MAITRAVSAGNTSGSLHGQCFNGDGAYRKTAAGSSTDTADPPFGAGGRAGGRESEPLTRSMGLAATDPRQGWETQARAL